MPNSAAGAGLGSSGGIMFVIILVVIGFMIYKKKKANKDANPFLSNRKNKDEVWKTIKKFLADHNESGKEIVDSYVVKRSHMDMVDPNLSDLDKINKNAEVKIRKMQYEILKEDARLKNMPAPSKPKVRDLFVIVFKTRNSKTGEEDPTRCFECEVVFSRVDKKRQDRKIVINGECDLDKEMEWIAPVRSAELAKQKSIDDRIAKQKQQEAKAEKKRRERVERRAQKYAKN